MCLFLDVDDECQFSSLVNIKVQKNNITRLEKNQDQTQKALPAVVLFGSIYFTYLLLCSTSDWVRRTD